ncbi:O-antigen ligase family protein [Bradyrhizobium sp. LMTR 3]|uniref:O-antigen ligase family protein n=1 Tax=Bradyrhizobium sp. LMTR 3 TaxID=189873 RepID=UPI0009FCE499|nr:O-antigen ligase family protein [Bradyrhizobium sp. LMTR 3]
MMRRYVVAPQWSWYSSAYDVALDVLLTVALLLSTASQLRFDGAPVGPGEICLALWGLLMLSREAARLGPVLSRPLSTLLVFWLSFAIAQCVGTMAGFVTGDRHDSGLFMHDIAAYAVAAAVSCLSVVEPGASSRLHRVAWLLVTCGAAWLLLQVAFGWGLVSLGDFDAWEWDRFRGLSDNANQLALLCTVLVLLSLHLAEVVRRFDRMIVAVICMVVAIVVGRLTMSDSFLLVLVLAGPIFVTLKLWKWLMSVERRMLLRSASAWILVLALPLVVSYVTPLGASVAAEVEESIKGMTKGGGGRDTEETTRLRIELWDGAIRRGVEAGMLGLGPGPHLEIPPTIVAGRLDPTNEPKHVEHPEFGDIPNFEAHNTFLDLFVQGGLIAVLSIVWLGAAALSVTRRAGLDALTTSIFGLAVFGIFHLIVRHPIVWFAISLSLVAAANSRRASKRRVES